MRDPVHGLSPGTMPQSVVINVTPTREDVRHANARVVIPATGQFRWADPCGGKGGPEWGVSSPGLRYAVGEGPQDLPA